MEKVVEGFETDGEPHHLTSMKREGCGQRVQACYDYSLGRIDQRFWKLAKHIWVSHDSRLL